MPYRSRAVGVRCAVKVVPFVIRAIVPRLPSAG
jgi:hypothetical protein